MTDLKAALYALFADAHLARDVVCTAEGGPPSLVRAILRRPDDVTGFGQARIRSETTRLDLRLVDAPRLKAAVVPVVLNYTTADPLA